jgi:hypothetical protein
VYEEVCGIGQERGKVVVADWSNYGRLNESVYDWPMSREWKESFFDWVGMG